MEESMADSDGQHTAYEKMSETTADWDVQNNKAFKGKKGAKGKASDKTNQWVVLEKVHGSNLCFNTEDGVTVRTAKRSAFLKDDDDFFGYKIVLNKYRDAVIKVYELLSKQYPDLVSVSIYGELFGGEYPHANVPKLEELQAVQTGIYYCPSLEFYAFDVAIQTKGTERDYLDYDAAIALFKEAKLFYAEPLFTGSYEECLDFPIKFKSTIPGKLKLPDLNSDNYAEGVVIKPIKNTYIQNMKGKKVRAIVKKKIEAFAEKMVIQDNKHKSSNAADQLKNEISALITENRLKNAISKFGRPSGTKAQQTKLQEMLVEDVLEALQDNQLFHKAGGKKAVIDQINKEAATLVKKYFEK